MVTANRYDDFIDEFAHPATAWCNQLSSNDVRSFVGAKHPLVRSRKLPQNTIQGE